MIKTYDTTPQIPKAILVGITLSPEDKEHIQEHLQELALLAHTKNIAIADTLIQHLEKPSPRTLIGKGKVEAIKTRIEQEHIDKVIFDEDLTPTQIKNLQQIWPCEVWDRSFLILTIFAMRAQTAQAKTQVELAQYQYLLPRLTGMWTHLSRQKGGASRMKGPGEKELETDKRLAQRKIHQLKKQLAIIARQNHTQRQQREKIVRVALVGYTNAGKSTLMRTMTHADVHAQDKLFATLTPTVRKVYIQQIPFLLTDTVGFIRKLPHTLIEAFKSTLSEITEADLLLHIIDASHPHHHEHIEVVHQTLQEIQAHHIPRILVCNKQDKIKAQGTPLADLDPQVQVTFLQAQKITYQKKYNAPLHFCNALDPQSVKALCTNLYKKIRRKHHTIYPHNKKGSVVQWKEQKFPKL